MRAGIAKIRTTPPVGVDLTGYVGRPGPSNKVHDDVYATALVLDDGTTRIGIIAIDLIGDDLAQDAALRDAISKSTGIRRENLLIGSSHTHAGPAIGVLRQCGNPDEAYVRRMFTLIESAAKEANANLVDARLSYVQGQSELAWNRRSWVIEAGVQQSETSGVITDPGISGLIVEMDGRKPVMLFNYACHGVVMGSENLEISADWIGAARDALVSSGKIIDALFLQGCCGNINPRWRGTFEEAKHAGESVAKPLLDAMATAKPIEDPKIKVAWKSVDLPYMPLPPAEELEQEISFRRSEIERMQAEGPAFHTSEINKAMLGWAQAALQAQNDGGGPASVTIGLQAIGIDGIAFASLPGEAFCEYGLAFRKMTKSSVLPVGYANGNIGYIPTAEAYNEGGYEVCDAIKYYAVKMIGPESEQIILDAMKELLADVE
jgi:neutral ceramidase